MPIIIYEFTSHLYREQRFVAFLHPWNSPNDVSYQLVQSLYAFGHGGLLGVGLGHSIQKSFYLPEAHTDFIFSIVGEEFGYMGCLIFLSVYALFIWRGISLALSCSDRAGMLLGIGLMASIAIQALVNLGGVTGCLPITGVPLPLISYGGSSLLFTLATLGVVLNISRNSSRTIQNSPKG